MTVDNSIAVIIAPGTKLTNERVKQAATALELDLYQTKRLLTSKLPCLVARQSRLQAEDTVHRLERLGIFSFTWRDEELLKSLEVFKANTLAFTADDVVFKNKNNDTVRLGSSDVFLIIKGFKKNMVQKEVARKSKRLNILGTILTGGIPIRKTVEEKAFETTTRDERFIRLFGKTSMDNCIEILQSSFNYSCLGSDMTPSALHNIQLLAGKIEDFFPIAYCDDRLSTPYNNNAISVSQYQNIDMACKLIYLWYQKMDQIKFD